jgi:hypothetical protein
MYRNVVDNKDQEVSMGNKKNILWKVLWFMVGMAVIISIPILLVGQCSQPKKAEIRQYQGLKAERQVPVLHMKS